MQQLIPFDPNKGGSTPNLCLNNVRLGYGIANKYGSAWQAWQHTQQHADRNIPAGLAVPLFYSYTATIDGVTENYGHINVQLPDGRVWSDGNYYASIEAYTANHSPKFVGWGESVNDFKIIGEDPMKPDPETFGNQIRLAYEEATEVGPTDEQLAAQLNQPDLAHVLISIKDDSKRAWAALHKQSDDKNIIIDDLRAQLNAQATPLKPGKYIVNG